MRTRVRIFGCRNILYIVLLIISVSLFISGCSQNLSRSKAGEIISKAKGFPISTFYSLPVTKVREGSISIFGPSWSDYLRAWTNLESMGFISLKRLGETGTGGLVNIQSDTVEISLTEKGKTTFTQGEGHFWKIAICKKIFVEVTGISKKDDNTAIVEYTWKYDKINPIANAVLNISDLRRTNLDEIHKDNVLMRKYDDGWRIEN